MNAYAIHLTSILCLLSAASLHGQSAFILSNLEPRVNSPVFNAGGQPLAGVDYLVELWGGAAANSLTPAVAAYTGERVIIPFGTGGYFRDSDAGGRGYSTVFSVPPVSNSWLQVRAWDARLGGPYEEVVSRGLGGYGESPLFQVIGSDPFMVPPMVPATLIGLQSFTLRAVVPEPSIWALLAMGGAGVWWHVRRRR